MSSTLRPLVNLRCRLKISSVIAESIGEMNNLEDINQGNVIDESDRENVYDTIDDVYYSESDYRPDIHETGVSESEGSVVPDREYVMFNVDRLSIHELELVQELYEDFVEESVEDANMMVSAETKKERKVLPGPFFWGDVKIFSNLSIELRGRETKEIEPEDLATAAEVAEDVGVADSSDIDLKNNIITIKLNGSDIPITKLNEFSSRIQKEIQLPEQSIIILCKLSELQGADGANADPL